MLLRALTWNVHKCIGGLDGRYMPQRVAEVIGHYEPDLVLLQEVDHGVRRSSGHDQADVLAKALGYRHHAHVPNVRVPGGGFYGNAILSRHPLERVTSIDLTVPPKKRRSALHARCRMRLGRHARSVHVVVMHLGLSGLERRLQLRKLLDAAEIRSIHERAPFLIAGDVNDVWGSLGPRVLEPQGFRGGARYRTFPSYAPLRPLDAMWVRGSLELVDMRPSRLELARQASDHLPLIGEIELR